MYHSFMNDATSLEQAGRPVSTQREATSGASTYQSVLARNAAVPNADADALPIQQAEPFPKQAFEA